MDIEEQLFFDPEDDIEFYSEDNDPDDDPDDPDDPEDPEDEDYESNEDEPLPRVTESGSVITDKLTRYEYVRILSIRTQQIMNGAEVCSIAKKENPGDPEGIALHEIHSGAIPLSIRRTANK